MKYYITTPIYYVNDRPHIGHAYATLAADTLARYHRLRGGEVYFVTGTDENAEKNAEAAAKAGETNVQAYVDRMSAAWQITWDELSVSNDDFIRTTEERHLKGVEKFWQAVETKGDLYKGTYEGPYCVGCEAFYATSDLVDGNCPVHNRPAETLKEENYFFKLSQYRDQLLDHIDKHPEFIQPATRRREVVNYITNHLEDISVSRSNKAWGIKVPGDDTQTIYVWFDALINYLTAAGYGTDDEKFTKWWPADLHVVGKDIIKFHCALWPAMLLSAGIALPRQVFAHGFFTINEQKIGKSLGNAIDPKDLVETYGVGSLKFFLLREIAWGGDGDFSIERVSSRYDSDLASGLGNYVSRTLAMAAGQPLAQGDGLKEQFAATWQRYHEAFGSLQLHEALEAVWEALRAGDRYIEQTKPWELKKDPTKADELAQVLGTLVESVRQIGWLLFPFLPAESKKIFDGLGWPQEEARSLDEAQPWGAQSSSAEVKKIAPLFPRLDG